MFWLPFLSFKLLVLFYITAKRQLIHNKTAQRNTWNQNYDFIIVGAGGSGCVVANRLSQDSNVSVLLLEAGGPQNSIYTDIPGMTLALSTAPGRPQVTNYYYNDAQNNLHLNYPNGLIREILGRVIGGSTSISLLTYFRAQTRDLDNWVNKYGAQGWSYKEVLPFNIRFENNTDFNIVRNNPGYHGTGGPIQITTPRNVHKIFLLIQRVFNELGFINTDVNAFNQTGTMIAQSYIDQNGFRSGSGNAYVDPNPHPNNLHIVTRARVLRILFNNLTAVGVEFDKNDISYRVYARKEVVVSAGAFQTPQLLMLSGIGPRNLLQTFGIPVPLDLPAGNNYQNIPNIVITSNINETLLNPPPEFTIDNISQLYFNKSGPLSELPVLLSYFSTSYNLNKEWPNIGLYVFALNGQVLFELLIGHTKSRGTVRLQSNNPYVPLKLYSNIYSESFDLDNAIEAVKFLLFLMERTSLAQYLRPNTLGSAGCPSCLGRYMYECNEGIRCYLLSQSGVEHPSGTCRMGSVERNDVVVDPNLRVKHAHNLRVCDTSIIPELPNNGITAEALMIGEKCSQMIQDYYGLK